LKNKKYVVCVDGVYVRNGKILLFKRNVEPLKGFWHVIGGQVEENETLGEALKREFIEETGLEVEVGNIIAGRIEETFDIIKIIIAFEVSNAHGEIQLDSENQAYGWFDRIPSKSVHDYAEYFQKANSSNKPP
jgi:8-oxo-dGTP diphosphatase